MRKNIHRKVLSLAIGLLFCGLAQAQFADLKVKTRDGATGKPLSGVLVEVSSGDIIVTSDTTNSDGNVGFTTLAPGIYEIILSKAGFGKKSFPNERLNTGLNKEFDEMMSKSTGIEVIDIRIARKKDPLSLISNGSEVQGSQITNSGARGTDLVTRTNSAVLATQQGISVRGTRADGNGSFIDGMRTTGAGGQLTLGTDAIAVQIGGIAAMYGDLTGGAFSTTTKGATRKMVGALEGITSTGLDAFGYNTLEGFLSGPLWTKKFKNDKGKTEEYVKIGYTVNGSLGYLKDPNPTRTGVFVVKENRLNEIENNPLIFTPNGFVHAASYLRSSDLENVKSRPNSPLANGTFIGKLEYRPNNLVAITGYASYYSDTRLSASNSIMNYKANPRSDQQTIRSYLQFTQNFKTDKESAVKNAYYSIRAEYQNASAQTKDANHGDNLFDYGYVGQFNSYPYEVFNYQNYDQNQNPNRQGDFYTDQYGNQVYLTNYWKHVGYADSLMTFNASDLNPLRAQYTKNVYDYYRNRGFTVRNSQQVQISQGLLNGFNPQSVYSLFATPGSLTAGWSKSNTERYSVFALGQMRLQPKSIGSKERTAHDLQAGMYYEQQIQRSYGLNANALWVLMGQLMNKHISQLDMSTAYVSYDNEGNFTDTVRFKRLVNYAEQSTFDRNFRQSLIDKGATDIYGRKVDDQTFVDINSYSPEDFKLSMFNADELLNNGNNYVSFYGYDYLGNKVNGKPGIKAFLNDKDKRTIGAFQPVYMAAWLQDQFQFKELVFRLGLRMERYDANQQVLRDDYSLYPVKTVGEVTQINGVDVNHPENIGGDYKVYVNNIKAPTRIVGYRDGSTWYNADGSEQKNPETFANQTNNGRIAPYLVNPNVQDVTENSLEDFTPVINLLPRIWFSFPLEPNRKTFYVSYDKLAQRPRSDLSFLSIDELYYLKNRQGNTISNGSLQPRTKTDYEVGYKQIFGRGNRLNKGIEIAASYSEIQKDFGLYQIGQGYPVTYITYRNIDFSTITGFRTSFILQDVGPFNLTTSYMLQFADGTGSNVSSQAQLIASNQPNLRNVIPLGELDIRHNFKTSATWAWGGGIDPVTKKNFYKGPKVNGREVFKHTSFNVIGNAYSGAPYTPTLTPVQIGTASRAQIKGVPFGARMPWQYTLDVNITKGFQLTRKDSRNPLIFNVFMWVQNVLNTKNVVSVYPYTGSSTDDGFLNSPQGQLAIQNQVSAQSFLDLYRTFLNSQTGFYGAPRTIRVGVRVNFN